MDKPQTLPFEAGSTTCLPGVGFVFVMSWNVIGFSRLFEQQLLKENQLFSVSATFSWSVNMNAKLRTTFPTVSRQLGGEVVTVASTGFMSKDALFGPTAGAARGRPGTFRSKGQPTESLTF